MRRKIISILSVFLILLFAFPVPDSLAYSDISAQSAVVYSPETKEFLYTKNSDSIMSMASTTKIMTALLTLEYCQQMSNKVVTITKSDVAVEGSSMGLREGDKITLHDLCVGMLLASGNDAANAAARNISNDFQTAMNTKAAELGMTSTHFVTPSGLDDSEHYSTAHDMALLAAAAMSNDEFASIASSKTMTVKYNSGATISTFTNHNKLLSYVDGCIGVKTGFTKKSGRCLVSAVKRDGTTLICVTLNAPDDWNDHTKLYDECFSRLTSYTPVNESFYVKSTGITVKCRLSDASKINCFDNSKIQEKIYLPRFVYVGTNDKIGRVDYVQNGKTICSRDIIISAQ